jgi:ATPase subunit of ABC transporter with duplicated ATPase domains
MYVRLRDEQIRNSMRVYQAYQSKRAHMMEFINTFRGKLLEKIWRVRATLVVFSPATCLKANAKRATMVQSRIKVVEKMDAEAPELVKADPLGRPIISIDDASFDYSVTRKDGSKKPESEYLLQKVNFGVDLSSRIAILGANGQGTTPVSSIEIIWSVCLKTFFFARLFRQDNSVESYHG